MTDYKLIQGDNGTILTFDVVDEIGSVDLTNATNITLFMMKDTLKITKQCSIENATEGRCRTILLSEDIPDRGTYLLQLTVNFSDDSKFSSNINKLVVGNKLM